MTEEKARPPTDSEEVARLKGELTRAAESMGDVVALHTRIHRLTEALKSSSVALNVCQGWLLGLGRSREAADADRWRDEAYQAALPQTCPVCGEGRHDGTCIDAALGEARGTASASESQKKTIADLRRELEIVGALRKCDRQRIEFLEGQVRALNGALGR